MKTFYNFLLIIFSFVVFQCLYIYISNKHNIHKIIKKKLNSNYKKFSFIIIGIIILSILQTILVNIFSLSRTFSLIMFSAEISFLNYLILYLAK